MKKACLLLALAVVLTPCLPAARADAAVKPSVATTPQEESDYTLAIEKRTADILSVLDLKDAAATKRVHDAIISQYRALRTWQATYEVQLKTLARQTGDEAKAKTGEIMATRKVLHDQFIAQLSTDLTPDQLDQVKDKMTYGKLKVTYDAYCQIVPGLTAEEKARMLDLLKEARELAMDGGSAAEKSAIFKKYKGKINTYLSSRGHDVGKAYKDWGAQQKQAAQRPVSQTNAAVNPARP